MTRRMVHCAAIAVGVVGLMGAGIAPAYAAGGPIRSFTATATTLTAVNEYSYFRSAPSSACP